MVFRFIVKIAGDSARAKALSAKEIKQHMKYRILIFFAAAAAAWVVGANMATAQQVSTRRVPDLPTVNYDYSDVSIPAHLNRRNVRRADTIPASNPITDAGATLGRVLFYDVALSANDTVSCSSCHLQENAFADPSQFSTGFDGEQTARNSMALTNVRFNQEGEFFWDHRSDSLEEQVLMPIQDSIEMGMDLETLEVKLANLDYYPALFEDAFGSEAVTSERISLALAQFVRSLVSYNSEFDIGLQTDFDNFTNQENRGRRVFNNECAQCHETNLQLIEDTFNIGLDRTLIDLGVGGVTGRNNDMGEFRAPSLRNIELTAPYMHDGRFDTLEEVVDHYDDGVVNSPNLSRRLRNRRGNGLNLNNNEKEALVAFLETLTDETFINDPRFSDPFVTLSFIEVDEVDDEDDDSGVPAAIR